MKLALNKHTNVKRDGEWNNPSQEEKQIVALRASLDEMKKERLQISKALKNHSGKGGRKGKGGDGTNKSRKKKGRGKDNADPWAWKKVPPSEGKPQKMSKDGKECNWCKCHQAWVLHEPQDCKKNPDNEDNKDNDQKVSFAAQLSRMLADDGSDQE